MDRLSRWELRDLSGLTADPAALVADESARGQLIDLLLEGMSELEREVVVRFFLQG